MADALVEYETIDTADIEIIMKGGTLSRPPPQKPMATTIVPDKKRGGLLDPAPPVPSPGKA